MKSKDKRVISILFALTFIASLVLNAYAYADTHPNTHQNTGNNLEDLISVARTQVGYTELDKTTGLPIEPNGAAGYTKYGDSFGDPTGEWCAYFLSWCAREADISTSVIPHLPNCSSFVNWFKANSEFHSTLSEDTYVPKVGDLVFFNWSGGTTAKHVGIVIEVTDSKIYTIEGNTGSDNGYMCCERTRTLSAKYIVGYGVPAYTDEDSSITNVSYKKISDTNYVFSATINGRPAMLQVIDEEGCTVTFDRYNSNIIIKTYDMDGNEVSSLDRTATYEVWHFYANLDDLIIKLRTKSVNGTDFKWETHPYEFSLDDI